MAMKSVAALGACLWWLVGASAQAASAAEQSAQTARALERGRALYALDEGAWGSTDDMLRRVPKASLPAEGGWVAEPDGATLRFTYYGIKDGARSAIYRAQMSGRSVVSAAVVAEGEDQTLSPQAVRLAAAREAAVAALGGKPACAKAPFNVLPMPAEDPDGTLTVYLLTPMVKAGAYPFGGHYAATVDRQGVVLRERSFTKSCLEMAKATPDQGGPPVVIVTHLLDETPTEIHVFMAMRMASTVVVATPPGVIWAVTGEEIEGPETLK